MLSHTRMGVPYEYTHMGRPIRVWANIRIWGRTAIMQHRRATAASMFQNGISRNTKCDNMVGFPKSSHIYCLRILFKSALV